MDVKRRDFLRSGVAALGAATMNTSRRGAAALVGHARPNVLWISVEDISPDLGCYGDEYAITPHLDAFAAEGTRFTAAFAHMGVCAPARSGIITGCYPTWLGTNHMRCHGVPPPEVRCFPEYLRAAGYYCTNRSKTDYQFNNPVTTWDVCGACDDWRGRRPGQPFFSVINLTTTHEGRIRSATMRRRAHRELDPDERHDPAKAPLPPYYPDTPVVRGDWAQYADNITLMDKEAAAILKRLEADGLADDTIVWFWADHGRGLPRAKRWLYDSGLHVPLLIRVPEKWRTWAAPGDPGALAPGSVNDDLVAFVDFAPTMLSLCGIPIPEYMQGQAFLGPGRVAPRRYIYAARDRVDEAYDVIRAVRDKRFKYLRNFMAHLPRSLEIDYMDLMPTMQEMRRLFAQGRLRGPQLQYFECPKPVEELYDTTTDPHEVHNLATDPRYGDTLNRLRRELFAWMEHTGDFGLLPECEFDALKRPGDRYETTAAPGVLPLGRSTGDKPVRVRLTCTTPGASLAYRLVAPPAGGKEGQYLSVGAATMHGKGARRRQGEVTYWRDPHTWLSWEVELTRAGKLPVHVLQAFARNDGRPYVLTVGHVRLEGVVRKTDDWSDYRFVKVGEVEIPAPGRVTVSLKPKDTTRPYSMNLKAVVIGARNPQAPRDAKTWQVYTEPVLVPPGEQLSVKACRLGFRDSKTVTWEAGTPAVDAERTRPRKEWRDVVDESGLVPRALALKEADGNPAAVSTFVDALSGKERDPSGSVRYWAVIGVHTRACTIPVPNDRVNRLEVLRACLDDPSPAVRIAAAQALCEWGESDRALPVLIRGLAEPLESTRLLAATALDQLGETARPALAEAEQLLTRGYPARMLKHLRRHLQR